MRHARGHAFGVGRPIVQSFEPGEDWRLPVMGFTKFERLFREAAGVHVAATSSAPSSS